MKTSRVAECIPPAAGCCSILRGTDKEITVNANSPGTTCVSQRKAVDIGWVNATPGTTTIYCLTGNQ